jgi:hypothetical protein
VKKIIIRKFHTNSILKADVSAKSICSLFNLNVAAYFKRYQSNRQEALAYFKSELLTPIRQHKPHTALFYDMQKCL